MLTLKPNSNSKWKHEHPGAGVPGVFEMPCFRDESWHNDCSPRFIYLPSKTVAPEGMEGNNYLEVWVEYQDERLREGSEFLYSIVKFNELHGPLYSRASYMTNDLGRLMRALRNYVEHGTVSNPSYAWKITKVWEEHGLSYDEVGIHGPRNITMRQRQILNGAKPGASGKFRMGDDDGNTYYEGLFLGNPNTYDGFAPLDDYGEGAGCVWIKYRNPDTGAWEVL